MEIINSLDNIIANLTSVAVGVLSISLIIYIVFYTNFLNILLAPLELIIPVFASGIFILLFLFYPYHYVTTFINCTKKNTSNIVNWKIFFGVNTPLMMLWIAGVLYIIKLVILFFN